MRTSVGRWITVAIGCCYVAIGNIVGNRAILKLNYLLLVLHILAFIVFDLVFVFVTFILAVLQAKSQKASLSCSYSVSNP